MGNMCDCLFPKDNSQQVNHQNNLVKDQPSYERHINEELKDWNENIIDHENIKNGINVFYELQQDYDEFLSKFENRKYVLLRIYDKGQKSELMKKCVENVIEEMKEIRNSLAIVSVDSNNPNFKELLDDFSIDEIPTCVLLEKNDGTEIEKLNYSNENSEHELKDFLKKYILL